MIRELGRIHVPTLGLALSHIMPRAILIHGDNQVAIIRGSATGLVGFAREVREMLAARDIKPADVHAYANRASFRRVSEHVRSAAEVFTAETGIELRSAEVMAEDDEAAMQALLGRRFV